MQLQLSTNYNWTTSKQGTKKEINELKNWKKKSSSSFYLRLAEAHGIPSSSIFTSFQA